MTVETTQLTILYSKLRTTMRWQDRIELNPNVLCGKPVVRNTRLSVEFIVGLLAQGWTHEQVLQNFPNLTDEDIRACLAYATERLVGEKIYPLSA